MPSLLQRIRAFANPAAESQPITPTPSNWVPVGGTAAQLSLVNWHKCAQRNQKLSQQNPIYSRLLEIIRDNVWGLGIKYTIKTKTPELQSVEDSLQWAADRFWNDHVNNMEARLPEYIKEHTGFGEIALPVKVNEQNGRVSLGYLPPTTIQDVQLNPNNIAEVLSIRTQNGYWKDSKKGGGMKWQGEAETYKVIRKDDCPFKLDDKGEPVKDSNGFPEPNPSHNRLNGDVFFFRNNTNIGTPRGYGDLVQVMDLCTNAEQFVYEFGEGYAIQQSYLWDVTVDTNSQKEIDKWSEMQVPVGQRFLAHNKKVSVEAKSPSLRPGDATEFLRLLLRMILGSVGIPESAFADGSQTNVATAREQMPMLYAKFNNKRKWWESNLEFILRFVIERANAAGMLYEGESKATRKLTGEELDLIDISVEFQPFERNNAEGLGAALSAISDALLIGKAEEWIDNETAASVYQTQLSQFGVDIDAEVVKTKVAQQPKGASGEPVDFTDVTR